MIREQRLLYLNPRDLLPAQSNVRSDPGDLAGLAETIREHGVLQPLGVTREDGGYRVVYGNRRRDAAIVVGLDRVPCIEVGPVDDGQRLVQQVLENLQRLDLNDMDKARAFQSLIDRLVAEGPAQQEALDRLARMLGLSGRQIQRYIRLNHLDQEVQQIVTDGDLGVTHAQHLVALEPASRQTAVARLAVDEGLSAGELSRLCAVLQRNANIDPFVALEALRRGERVPVFASASASGPAPASQKTPSPEEDAEDDWENDDPDEPEDANVYADDESQFANLQPATQDGNRVRKIHSMDAFMDELQRLTQCTQDGDLQRFLGNEETARVKIRLAVRQLRYLTDMVSALAEASE